MRLRYWPALQYGIIFLKNLEIQSNMETIWQHCQSSTQGGSGRNRGRGQGWNTHGSCCSRGSSTTLRSF